MKHDGQYHRLAAMLVALVLVLSLSGASAQPTADAEEQGFLGSVWKGVKYVGSAFAASLHEEEPAADEEQGFLRNAFGKVKEITIVAYDKTKSGLSSAAGSVRDGFVKVGNAIYEEDEEQGSIHNAFGKIKRFVTEMVDQAGDGPDTASIAAQKGASDLVNIIYGEEDETQGFIRDTWRKTKDLGKKVMTAVWEEAEDMALSGTAAATGEAVSALEDEEQGFFGNILKIAQDVVKARNPANWLRK